MGMLARIKKKLLGGWTGIKIKDPVLGELYFYDFEDPKRNYWEGAGTYVNAHLTVGLAVHADFNGPSEQHRQFFLNLVSDLDHLFRRCQKKLVPEWEAWCDATFPTVWQSEFTLVHIMIPTNGDSQNAWEVTFEAKSELNHLFSVYFQDNEAIYVTVDG